MVETLVKRALPVALALLGSISCSGANVASELAESSRPTFEPEGQTKCSVKSNQAKPLIVEWPSADRAELESRVKKGTVVVRYDGCEMQVLSRCTAPGDYQYVAVTPKKDLIRITNADELWANVPIGAAKLEGKLATAGELNVAITMVGRYEAAQAEVRSSELGGSCEGATHVLTGVTVGAFEFYAGGAAEVGGAVDVAGIGAGANSKARHETLSEDGDMSSCSAESSEESRPPADCAAMLRLETAALIKDVLPTTHGASASAVSGSARIPKIDALPPEEIGTCGTAPECLAEGLRLHLAGEKKYGGDPPASARSFYQKACDADVPEACIMLVSNPKFGGYRKRDKGAHLQLAKKACDLAVERGGRDPYVDDAIAPYLGSFFAKDHQFVEDPFEQSRFAFGWGCHEAGQEYDAYDGIGKNRAFSLQYHSLGCDLGLPESCEKAAGHLWNQNDVRKAFDTQQRACQIGDIYCDGVGSYCGPDTVQMPVCVEALKTRGGCAGCTVAVGDQSRRRLSWELLVLAAACCMRRRSNRGHPRGT